MYRLKDSIILRNIDGIYFCIDSQAKYYYHNKGIDQLNSTGYQLLNLMKQLVNFDIKSLTNAFRSQFTNLPSGIDLEDDIQQFLNEFIRKGYIISDDPISPVYSDIPNHKDVQSNTNNISLPQLVLDYWGKRRHIYSAGIELTTMCNLKCVHCYNQNEPHCAKMSTSDVFKILDILFDYGVLMVYFTGGEIFTRKDFLDIYLYAKKKGFVVEILTNSTLITEEAIELFKQYPPSNISISIYGKDNSSYYNVTGDKFGFTKLDKSVSALAKADLNFELKYIVLKENFSDHIAIKEYSNSFGKELKYGFELFPTLHGDNKNAGHQLTPSEILEIEKLDGVMSKKLYKSLHGKKVTPTDRYGFEPLYMCSISRYMILIDYEGYIQPCTLMRSKQYNILTDDLAVAWKNYERFIKMPAPKNYKCKNCKDFKICNPCVEKNKLFNNAPDIPSAEHCRLIHMRAEEFYKDKYK